MAFISFVFVNVVSPAASRTLSFNSFIQSRCYLHSPFSRLLQKKIKWIQFPPNHKKTAVKKLLNEKEKERTRERERDRYLERYEVQVTRPSRFLLLLSIVYFVYETEILISVRASNVEWEMRMEMEHFSVLSDVFINVRLRQEIDMDACELTFHFPNDSMKKTFILWQKRKSLRNS